MCRLISVALLLGGCASASLTTDVARVRDLSQTDALPTIEHRVEPETGEQTRDLLKTPIDAQTAVRIALLNNRELRAQLRDMGVERGQLMQAGAIANPLFEIELLPERNTTVQLRVEYEISSFILAPVRAHAAASDLEAARYRVAGAVVQAGFEARAAFYALQGAQARIEVATRALDAFAASNDAAAALLTAGNIRELDAATQLLAYERAKLGVAKLQRDLVNAREHMHRVLGLSSEDTQWSISAKIETNLVEPKLPEKLETTALQASLDMNETKQRLEALARKAGYSALSGWLPDLNLDVHALVGDPGDATGNTVSAPVRFGGGLSIRLPFFDQRRGATRGYEAQRDAMLERYYGLAINLRSHVRQARNELESAHARSEQYQRVVLPTQARVFEQTLRQYNAMQVSIFALLQARRDQLDLELDYIDTLSEYWTARAAMDALIAGKQVMNTAATTRVSFSASTGEHQ